MSILAQYGGAVAAAVVDRRSLLHILAFAAGGGGAAVLWRQATRPIDVEDEPVFKRRPHAKEGVVHSHGDGHLHSHGEGGTCEAGQDAEAEDAFRRVLRSLIAAGRRNQSGLGVNAVLYIASIFARTWVTVRLAMCAPCCRPFPPSHGPS